MKALHLRRVYALGVFLLACTPEHVDAPERGVQAHLQRVEALDDTLLASWEGRGVLRVQGQDVDRRQQAMDSLLVEGLLPGEYRLWLEGSDVVLTQLVGENRLVFRSELALPGAMDVWGEGDLAVLAGGDNGAVEVLLVDVSDPLDPRELSRIEGDTPVRDVKLREGLLVSTADEPSLTRLYDVSDPQHPELLSELPGAHNVTLGEGTMAAIHRQTMSLYDLSDPSEPLWLADWSAGPPPHDATWIDDTLYVAWGNGFAVLDVSDPTSPTVMWQQVVSGQLPGIHNIWPIDHGFITSQEVVGGHLEIWDPDEGLIGGYEVGENSVHNVYGDGVLAYAAWYVDGVVLLELSDPTAPVLLGHLETWEGPKPSPEEGRPVIQGAWGLWPFGEHILVGDTERGLLIVDYVPTVVEAR